MARLKLKNGHVEDYTIVLSTRDFRHLGQLTGITETNNANHLNSANELSFNIYKYDLLKYDPSSLIDYTNHVKIKTELWNQIVDLKLVWIKELDEYFEIKVTIQDSNDTIKTITGTSLCEAELGQIILDNTEINTEADIERDAYQITKFYNESNPEASLLHRVLDKAPHYTIKYVDDSLKNLQRTFSISDTTIYDFLTGECSEQFDCLFQFNTSDRSISVYDLYTVCNDCGKRGDYYDKCPECGSTNLKYFGKDTTILVDKNNLTDSIQLETDVDSVKNCFKLVAGDELMTATVKTLNPNGSDYIYYFSENQLNDMPFELVDRLNHYNALVDSYTEEYQKLVSEIYDLTDDILYLESWMMPTVENGEVNASTEAAKLTVENLSPLGLSKVTTSTTVATVDSALKNYAKVYVKTGYVKIETGADSKFTYIGINEDDSYHHGTWFGKFIVTNYSDEEDVVETGYMNIDVYDNYHDFVEQKILKTISQDDEEGTVFDVLSIKSLEYFKEALKLYSKNRLKSFYDAIQGALDVLITLDQATEYADLYASLYTPYYEKLQACQVELDKRQSEIDVLQKELDSKDSRRMEIQNKLNFQKYLGEYYYTFCAYRREEKYTNENYISDGLSNTELIEQAQQFTDLAKKELFKSGELQYTLSSTLNNLLVLPEFAPIVDNFELGNWIRVKVDGVLYRLRLIGYTIDFNNLQTINVEFSTITRMSDVAYEAQQIIQSAQSMSSSYGYVSKQAEKGNVAQNNIESWMQDGLNSGLINIQSGTNNEITTNKHGMLCRAYDDITGTYDDKQLKITHNVLAFTDNNWKTVRQVLGEHTYSVYNENTNKWETSSGYGLTSDFVQSGQVSGATIVGGEIYSDNYSNGLNKDAEGTYINLTDGTFSFAGGNLIYNKEGEFIISSKSIEDSLQSIGILTENLKIRATDIEGVLDGDQIGEVYADKISGLITDSQIESISSNKIDGIITSEQIDETLSDKVLSGSFSGTLDCEEGTIKNLTTKSLTVSVTEEDTTTEYVGVTGEYIIGDATLKIVNGIIVAVTQNTDTV